MAPCASYRLDSGTGMRRTRTEPVVVLTAPWHERGTQSLVERLGVPVFVPPPDTADDLVRKYGITPEQAGGGSPDVAWLLPRDGGEAHLYGVLRGDGAQVVQRAAE